MASYIGLGTSRVSVFIAGRDLPFLLDGDELNAYLLIVGDHKSVHCLDCSFCLFRVVVLNECISFAGTGLRVSVDIYIVDFTKGLKQFLEIFF